MAEFKLVISDPKTGKSYQKELKDDNAKALIGKKIKQKFTGETIDMTGYEFEITGGSDFAGFPMRWDVEGTAIKKIFSTKTMGLNIKDKGIKRKKTFAGNTIYEKTAQINVKILKQGKESLEPKAAEEAKPAEAEAPAEPAKEEKAETPKEEPKAEEKKEEPKKEEKAEAPKEEPKAEEKKE